MGVKRPVSRQIVQVPGPLCRRIELRRFRRLPGTTLFAPRAEDIYYLTMRHGWAYIYESPPASSRLDELVDRFALDGITLDDPGTGIVSRVSPVGDQIPSSREDIRAECVASQKVNFNFYIAPSDNVFCSIEKIQADVVRESFALDGKTEEQSFRVIEDLIQLFCGRAAKGLAFGFVADRYAELHQHFHWDDFFVGKKRTPSEWPIVLGCSDNFSKLNVIPTDSYTRTHPGLNCNLFRKMDSVSR
jgi:hypothetical protein